MTTIATLPPLARSATDARRLVERVLAEAQLEHVLDEALLLVTELVTNAVVHAGTELVVAIETDDDGMRLEVTDRSPGMLPGAGELPPESREGGRGIFLLDALATEWGTRHSASGKSIWFRLGGAPRRLVGTALPPTAGDARRDISWLVGLPAELEQRLSPTQLFTELLHRLVEALDLRCGWVVAQSDDDHAWAVVGRHLPDVDDVDADVVRRAALGGVDTQLPDSGLLVLPLRSRSGAFGALVLAGPDALSTEEVALARLVGDRIGIVLRDERSQAAQLRTRGSLALLAEASEMFAGTLDVQLAATLAAQLVVPRFAAWSAVFTTFEDQPRLLAVAHGDESRSAALRVALSHEDGQRWAEQLVRDLADQRPLLVPVAQLPAAVAAVTHGDVLAVPLLARRRLLGVLVVARGAGASYGVDDLGLLADLGRRAALAVDNARLYEERTAIAQALQASLLPPTLPAPDRLEFGARYAAAGEGNDVGGDFYDVFSLDDGGWGIAIGDVCGKGAEAAAITGMARNVLRLLTRDGVAPPGVLQRLNEVILELGDRGRFCTTTLGTVAVAGDGLEVRFSSAGHPPPVLLRRGGEAAFVGTSGTVLGVVDDVDVAEDRIRLEPGDALVFYTDGVTERRRGSDMFGDENLLASLRACAGSSADVLAGKVEQDVRQFGAGPSRDDLAVLVVRCQVPRAGEDAAAAPRSRRQIAAAGA